MSTETDQAPGPDFTVDATDYAVGQDNVRPFGRDIHNPVFVVSASTIVVFTAVVLLFPTGSETFFAWLRPWLTSTFDWVFMSATNIFVLFCLFLVLSPWGKIRLGGADAKPDFSYVGWFAMLFAAGMGIGLMFFAVLEPVYHFQNPPLGVDPENVAAAQAMVMAGTIFHWGVHPWTIYAVVALSLAFFTFNNGLPLTIHSAFFPLLGDRVWGWPGHIIDTLAVFATLFGLATSLGFGAQQASAGLEYLFGIPSTETTRIVLIIAITGVALLSVLAGLEAGVKRLSEFNMLLAALLPAFVIVVGPTLAAATGFIANAVAYYKNMLPLSNFVIARVSRGQRSARSSSACC